MKLLLFVIFNAYIPSNSEWICDKDSGKCVCDDGICKMNGQTYYSDYVCTPNAESCTINCIENYSCFQANLYMTGRNAQIKCNSHHSCLNSKIHCDGDIDSCRIQIDKNAMIDGYIQCNNNVSNCIVDIISKPKEIAIQRTIFACTNRFGCQLNGCNNNQCIETQMKCMNQSNCICNGNDCDKNIVRNTIKSKRIVNKRYLLDNSTKTTEIVISGEEDLAVTQFTAIEYIVITISLLFCLGTFGIFLIICYCQRLKSQALQQFRTTQKQSSMHHQSEHSINQLKYAISDDDHQTMTRLSIKNQSNTSNKSNMTNTSNISNVSVPSTTGIRDNQRQKKEHNYPHHTMKRSRSRETGYSLKPQALKMKKTLSAGNIPPPNPVQLRSSESYVSSESHLPQLISLTDHVSNSYNSHFMQQQQVQHSQSQTQPFNMVGSYNNNHFNYPKPALALESESLPQFNDATDNNHRNLQRAKTISIDQNGVQHHHHIYYINTMQPQLSSPHSQPRTPSQARPIQAPPTQAQPIQAPSISYGPLNNAQASSSLPFHSNPPQISPQMSYNTNWTSNVLPNFQTQQHQQQKLPQKLSMTPPIPVTNPDQQRLNVHRRIQPLQIPMAYHSKPLTSGSPYSDLTSVTSTHITGNIQNSMSPETNISDQSINHCCNDSSDDSLPTRSGDSCTSSSSSSSCCSSSSCSTPSKTSRQGQFSFDDDSDRNKISQKIMVKKSINKNCVYANISVLSPKSGDSDTNITNNRELSGAVASVLGEIIGIKKHKSLEISEDTNNNLNTNEASNNISNDAQYNYASSQFSLSETPQPESYVSSLPRQSCSTNNHTNIYDSSNRYSNVITNIKKQKKPYKY